MAFILARFQRPQQQLLEQVRRAEIVVPFDAQSRRADRGGQNAKADTGARCEWLAVGPRVQHPVTKLWHGEGRSEIVAGKAQFAVSGILQQVDGMPGGALVFMKQLQRGRFALELRCPPVWALAIRALIEHFDPAQLALSFEVL